MFICLALVCHPAKLVPLMKESRRALFQDCHEVLITKQLEVVHAEHIVDVLY